MEQPYLSIIIPAYKEERRIHKVLDAIEKYQQNHDFTMEVLVVLDGTPDKTYDSALAYRDRVKGLTIIDRKENKGKGLTVQEGMLKATGKYRMFCDADNSTPFHQVDKLLGQSEKYDVVIGSRRAAGGGQKKKQSLFRRVGSKTLNLIIQALAVRGISDTQCGFKLFSAKAAEDIFKRLTITHWSFDIEVLAIARVLGFQILEVPIVWNDDPHSNVSPIKDGLKMVIASWNIRNNVRAGLYK